MTTFQVEYVGFHNSDRTRDYRLLVHGTDGQRDEFVVAISQEAFVSGRVRYQDGAEICFMKLSLALAACTESPGLPPPEPRLEVTDLDLVAYRDAHAPRPRAPRTPAPAAGPR